MPQSNNSIKHCKSKNRYIYIKLTHGWKTCNIGYSISNPSTHILFILL